MLARSQVGAVQENRRFVRVKPAGLVSRTGKIVVDPKKPPIDCNILDMSAGGACLEISSDGSLPKRFVLLHSGTKKSCVMVWTKGRRLGVAF